MVPEVLRKRVVPAKLCDAAAYAERDIIVSQWRYLASLSLEDRA